MLLPTYKVWTSPKISIVTQKCFIFKSSENDKKRKIHVQLSSKTDVSERFFHKYCQEGSFSWMLHNKSCNQVSWKILKLNCCWRNNFNYLIQKVFRKKIPQTSILLCFTVNGIHIHGFAPLLSTMSRKRLNNMLKFSKIVLLLKTE